MHAIDPCGSFWWKNVFKLSPIFRGLTSCVIGNGNSVLLWKDLWLDEVAQEKYPRGICKQKWEKVPYFYSCACKPRALRI